MGRCLTCPKFINRVIPEGTITFVKLAENEGYDTLGWGTPTHGPWSAWGAWTPCVLVVRWRKRTRTCTRIDRIKPWTKCTWIPAFSPGVVGVASRKGFCSPRNLTVRWPESDREFQFCIPFFTALIDDLLDLAGHQVVNLDRTGAGRVEQYARLGLASLADQDDRVERVRYFLDGEAVENGQSWDDLAAGYHVFQIVIEARDGSSKVVNAPIEIVPPFAATPVDDAAVRIDDVAEVASAIVLTNNVERELACQWEIDYPGESGDVMLREADGSVAENPLVLAEREQRTFLVSFAAGGGGGFVREEELRAVDAAATLTIRSGRQRYEATVETPSAAIADQLALNVVAAGAAADADTGAEEPPVATPPVRTERIEPRVPRLELPPTFARAPLGVDVGTRLAAGLRPFSSTEGGSDPLDVTLADAMREILLRGLSVVPARSSDAGAPQVDAVGSGTGGVATGGDAPGPAADAEGEPIAID